MKRIDPDALHRALVLRWGIADANTVCPEVAEPERPEPYDYHADWTRHPDPSGNNDVTWFCKYCDGWTDYPPKARHACPELPAEPANPAPAADPRRLTDEELKSLWHDDRYGQENYRAVADAQFKKARVTISEAELLEWWRGGGPPLVDLYALLRSKGVEVVP